jgi:hypothetical protein
MHAVALLSVANSHLAVVQPGLDATTLWQMACTMSDKHTTAVVQRYLDDLAEESSDVPTVRALRTKPPAGCASCALRYCTNVMRSTHPPLNLQADELLGPIAHKRLV